MRRKKKSSDRKTIVKHYDSVTEFMNLKPSEINYAIAQGSCYKSNAKKSWYGVSGGYEQVIKEVNTGWLEGYKKALELRSQIVSDIPMAQSIKRRRVFSDTGDNFHIDRLYNGQYETCFSDMKRKDSNGNPIRRIFVAIGDNGGTSAEKLFYQGVCAAILTDALEDAGYRIELIAYMHSSGCFTDGSNEYTSFVVKNSDNSMSLSRLNTVVGLSGFFRFYGFKALHSVDKRTTHGLGCNIDKPLQSETRPDDIILTQTQDKTSCINRIKEVLKSFS